MVKIFSLEYILNIIANFMYSSRGEIEEVKPWSQLAH